MGYKEINEKSIIYEKALNSWTYVVARILNIMSICCAILMIFHVWSLIYLLIIFLILMFSSIVFYRIWRKNLKKIATKLYG